MNDRRRRSWRRPARSRVTVCVVMAVSTVLLLAACKSRSAGRRHSAEGITSAARLANNHATSKPAVPLVEE